MLIILVLNFTLVLSSPLVHNQEGQVRIMDNEGEVVWEIPFRFEASSVPLQVMFDQDQVPITLERKSDNLLEELQQEVGRVMGLPGDQLVLCCLTDEDSHVILEDSRSVAQLNANSIIIGQNKPKLEQPEPDAPQADFTSTETSESDPEPPAKLAKHDIQHSPAINRRRKKCTIA